MQLKDASDAQKTEFGIVEIPIKPCTVTTTLKYDLALYLDRILQSCKRTKVNSRKPYHAFYSFPGNPTKPTYRAGIGPDRLRKSTGPVETGISPVDHVIPTDRTGLVYHLPTSSSSGPAYERYRSHIPVSVISRAGYTDLGVGEVHRTSRHPPHP